MHHWWSCPYPALLESLFLLLPLAYAEIHYTLKGFSLVFRKRPEILADAPWRIEPGQTLPLLILIKDADKFPVRLASVSVELQYEDGTAENTCLLEKPVDIRDPWWMHIGAIRPRRGYHGRILMDVRFEAVYINTGKKDRFLNDNLWSSSHRPLTCTAASDPLPSLDHWIHGDLHFHSAYTNDQVEYGAPLQAAARMAQAMGLGFMAATDHSYDLDDCEDSFLKNDPDLPKWNAMHRETETIEQKTGLTLLPGEEVSAGNHGNENVHLLLLNNKDYYPGAGDSNEQWFKNRPDLTLREILDQMDEDTLAFAAHPGVPFAPLQWILLKRGIWNRNDYGHPRLHGLQIYNGCEDRAFSRGRRDWVKQLLNGRRLIVIAGNDAHGNFNRHRKLGQPFLYVAESEEHTFGRGRTLVHLPGGLTRKTLMAALRDGKCSVTTGPAADIRVTNAKGESSGIGSSVSCGPFILEIRAKSTPEFGKITRCDLYVGNLEAKKESLIRRWDSFQEEYRILKTAELSIQSPAYIRVELFSGSGKSEYFCMTNPVWIESTVTHNHP